jgi:hypothetical protein
MNAERSEIRVTLSDDARTAKLEMLVADRVVGAVVLDRNAVDYHINALSRLRDGMAE